VEDWKVEGSFRRGTIRQPGRGAAREFSLFVLLGLLALSACHPVAEPLPQITAQPATREAALTRAPSRTSTSAPTPFPGVSAALPAPVQALVYDPNDRRGAYALLTSNAIYHIQDRGQSWDRLPFPPPGRVVEKTGQDPKSTIMQAEILVSEYYPGRLIVRAGNALYRSDDSGQTWRELIDGWLSGQARPIAK
jgi:hypothetical protein